MAFNYCTLNGINKQYIIYILVFLCVVIAIYLYATNRSYAANSANSNYANYANSRNKKDGSNDLWYGLNAGGTYRGYGREYAGHLSPGRIYGTGTQ